MPTQDDLRIFPAEDLENVFTAARLDKARLGTPPGWGDRGVELMMQQFESQLAQQRTQAAAQIQAAEIAAKRELSQLQQAWQQEQQQQQIALEQEFQVWDGQLQQWRSQMESGAGFVAAGQQQAAAQAQRVGPPPSR